MSRNFWRVILALSLAACFEAASQDAQMPDYGPGKAGQAQLAALLTYQTAALQKLKDGLGDLDVRVTRLESGSRNGR